MSDLIDALLKNTTLTNTATQGRDGRWYIAQPIPAPWNWEWRQRVRDAWRVLTGRSQAWHYKDQE
jgi:hypothetical protein